MVDHGATRTTYEPVRATVSLGSLLPGGATVGRLEALGSHCAPATCLHWGWLRGATYLDPLQLVGAGPVRLLPLTGSATGAAVLGGVARWRAPAAAYASWRPVSPPATVPPGVSTGVTGWPRQARGCACW